MWRLPIYGDARHRMTRQLELELVRHKLLQWNSIEVGDIFKQIERLEANIVELWIMEDQERGLHKLDLRELHFKLSLYHSLLRQQETFWRQKSRVQWIRKGDRNTRFFHQATMVQRSSNCIRQLRISDSIFVDGAHEIKEQLFQLSRSQWTEHLDEDPLCKVPRPGTGSLTLIMRPCPIQCLLRRSVGHYGLLGWTRPQDRMGFPLSSTVNISPLLIGR